METTLFSKENLVGMLGHFDFNENTEEWILQKVVYCGHYCKIKINKNKIKHLLNKTKKTEFENLALYKVDSKSNQTYFEHVVREEYKHPSFKIEPLKTSTLEISIDSLSDEYSLFFYLSKSLDIEDSVNLEMKLSEEYGSKTIDFWELIRILNEKIFQIQSLKIKSIKHLSLDDMERLAKAYIFNRAYRENAIFSMNLIFKEGQTIYPNDRFYCPEEYILELDIKKELLDYYLRALIVGDPFASFISFYHIFEYFFKICEEEFRKNISLEVTNQFKFKGSNEEIKDIIFKQDLNNEKKLLELVFRRFIKDKKSFKAELNCITDTYLKTEGSKHESKVENKENFYYSYLKERGIKFETKVDEENLNYYSYLKTRGIKFDSNKEKSSTRLDDDNFYKTLTERVYTVRNALVHRKEGHKEPKYLPFEKVHREELREELPLMKVIANRIILSLRSSN